MANFNTIDLPKNIDALMFIAGQKAKPIENHESINIKAVERLGELHNALKDGGYTGHRLQQFLVRILFCLFAEDTDIFQDHDFEQIVKSTREDGTDLGAMLAQTFEVLDTPTLRGGSLRSPCPPKIFENLPYINGDLFKENLQFTNFTTKMRQALVACCDFDWAEISPAVFGSLFQCVMDPVDRRKAGAHYTPESDILKVIRSLFLDEIEQELRDCGNDKNRLSNFHKKLISLTFLDPACGCGNFLVVVYKNLRRLEFECLTRLSQLGGKKHVGKHGKHIDPNQLQVSMSQMYGIEIDEWAARIAEVALVLTERQEDQKILHGISWSRFPLKNVAKIHISNALRTDWNIVLPASNCSYVVGNPPFIGHHLQTKEQKEDQHYVWGDLEALGVLDYVTNWYAVATRYMRNTSIRAAFVSTSSITEGEQPAIYWGELLKQGICIQFAHRSFKWESEASGGANVHVVIIGFGFASVSPIILWDYPLQNGNEGQFRKVKRLNPYLFDGPDILLSGRSNPICDVPPMQYGNKPTDGGHFSLTPEERLELLKVEPKAAKYIRPYTGATEFLEGTERYCLWLVEITPKELNEMPRVSQRVDAVREFRLASPAQTTRDYARYPTLFRQIAKTTKDFILVPSVTSEKRTYIPFAYCTPEIIASNACFMIPDASISHFGFLSSLMHMAWIRQFCGRLKSDYRYSKDIVYNNFPFPQNISEAQRKSVQDAAQSVLDTRKKFGDQKLSGLYGKMPPELVKAHEVLDRSVDRCYRTEPFPNESLRIEFLCEMYRKLLPAELFGDDKSINKKRGRKSPKPSKT